MITDKDIEKLMKVFATKKDLEKFITKDDLRKLERDLKTEISGLKIDILSQGFDIDKIQREIPSKAEFTDLKDKILDRMDAVYTELKKSREEQSAHWEEHRRINDDLNVIKSVPIIAQAFVK